MASIYGLIDPRSDTIRYIGATTQTIKQRLASHCVEKGRSRKVKWIDGLKRLGLRPLICELEHVDDVLGPEHLFMREMYWIHEFKRTDIHLVNGNDGGRGGQRGNHNSLGRTLTVEERQHLSAVARQQWTDPEYVAKQMASRNKPGVGPHFNAGVVRTEENKQKISASVAALWTNPEYRQTMAAARKTTHCKRGHPWTEENTYTAPSSGERQCRECNKLRQREYQQRKNSNIP